MKNSALTLTRKAPGFYTGTYRGMTVEIADYLSEGLRGGTVREWTYTVSSGNGWAGASSSDPVPTKAEAVEMAVRDVDARLNGR